jgi:hypothetical protein
LSIQPDCWDQDTTDHLPGRGEAAEGQQVPAGTTAAHCVTLQDLAHKKQTFALLVLREPPPVLVQKHGRLAIADALRLEDRHGGLLTAVDVDQSAHDHFADITWQTLRDVVSEAEAAFDAGDRSVNGTVARLAAEVLNAVERHSARGHEVPLPSRRCRTRWARPGDHDPVQGQVSRSRAGGTHGFAGISCRTAHPSPPRDPHRQRVNTPKMPGEPKRVQPSRNRDLTRGNAGPELGEG